MEPPRRKAAAQREGDPLADNTADLARALAEALKMEKRAYQRSKDVYGRTARMS
jgi:hypothetical protein